ncbi:MAG TPA: KTSC domain-containing protein [Kiritimatiellia bacterium]|nr:KTSC domain-containing protein [Kiritimatiellia bacterium]
MKDWMKLLAGLGAGVALAGCQTTGTQQTGAYDQPVPAAAAVVEEAAESVEIVETVEVAEVEEAAEAMTEEVVAEVAEVVETAEAAIEEAVAEFDADVAEIVEAIEADVAELDLPEVAELELEETTWVEEVTEAAEAVIEDISETVSEAAESATAAMAGITAAAAGAVTGLWGEKEADAIEEIVEAAPEVVAPEGFMTIGSSAIDAVSYNADEQVLSIAFPGGDIYDYANVPADLFAEFMSAQSKGGFFATRIKDRFEGVKRD